MGTREEQQREAVCLRGMRGDERPLKLEDFLVHFPEKELIMVIWDYKKMTDSPSVEGKIRRSYYYNECRIPAGKYYDWRSLVPQAR